MLCGFLTKNENNRQKCLSMRSDDGRQARVKHGGKRGGGAGKVRERCGTSSGRFDLQNTDSPVNFPTKKW